MFKQKNYNEDVKDITSIIISIIIFNINHLSYE